MTKNKPKPTWKAWTAVEDDRETVHVARHNGKAEIHIAQRIRNRKDLGQTILVLIGQVQSFADDNPRTFGNPDNSIETHLMPSLPISERYL